MLSLEILQSSVRHAGRQLPKLLSNPHILPAVSRLIRFQSTATNVIDSSDSIPPIPPPIGLSRPTTPRFNEVGVQQISSDLYSQIFRTARESTRPSPDLIALSQKHLTTHNLFGKATDPNAPIAFEVPELHGKTLDEHFYRLGKEAGEPYYSTAKEFARQILPEKPKAWVVKSGWTKYVAGKEPVSVEAPEEEMLVFDVEVLYKQSPFAVMASAASPNAWYMWLSPWLLKETENPRQLIPLGDPTKPRVVVGHNIGYDRGRVLEEYDIHQTENFFLDTMSLHVAVNGMCSRQRPAWMKHRKDRELREKFVETGSPELARLLDQPPEEAELWVGKSSVNSLRDVAQFHCNITLSKEVRDKFGELDRDGVMNELETLMNYCAADVEVTHNVFKAVLPAYLERCPHPVSFAALRHLASVILPVDKSWETYVETAEKTYQDMAAKIQETLLQLTEDARKLKANEEVWKNDPWLRQLDWSGQEVKLTKKGVPYANQRLPGEPNWYKGLFPKKSGPINITVRSRVAPVMFRLQWEGYPLVWSDIHGWTFRVPQEDLKKFENKPVTPCDMSDEKNLALKDDRDAIYYKVPHREGPTARCANPLAKNYLQYFESGILSSAPPIELKTDEEVETDGGEETKGAKAKIDGKPAAHLALEMNAACSYWISARERIRSQMVVYQSDVGTQMGLEKKEDNELGAILPQIIPMGTITRRAVENTWLTASNAKKNRVGSELKAMVKAPPGYCFVGADVDSEELWIASLVGDAQFKLHGGNALGFMTLEGTKSAGTDLHSRTASILGISRNDAKIFNYGRIYGAGVNYATTLLRQFNPMISDAEADRIANTLYKETKGCKTNKKAIFNRVFWRGGTESFVFNMLEEFADQDNPRTPVLGAGITDALNKKYISPNGFMTSRINWAVQSSGVDYLHLLIVGMDFLIRRYRLDARVSITVHDEIRYLCTEKDKYRVAMALQVANLWTRAMFAQQVGIDDLPQSCAFFSAVDVDRVLRKEVDMDCITPSNPVPIPHGESLDIQQLLALGDEARLDPKIIPRRRIDTAQFSYEERIPVMTEVQKKQTLHFIRAQMATEDEIQEITKELKSKAPKKTKVSRKSSEDFFHYEKDPEFEKTFGWRTKDFTTVKSKQPVSHNRITGLSKTQTNTRTPNTSKRPLNANPLQDFVW